MDKQSNIAQTESSKAVLQKRLEDLNSMQNICLKELDDIETISQSINQMSLHPRHQCVVPVCDNLYAPALLTSSEYLIKIGSYSALVSLTQSHDYLKRIADEVQMRRDAGSNEIEQINERLNMLSELSFSNAKEVAERCYVVEHDGFTVIVEVDPTPYKRERVPKFKTAAERDSFLKNVREKKN